MPALVCTSSLGLLPARLQLIPHLPTLPLSHTAASLPPPMLAVMNWAGSMVALLGTGLYSLAKQKATDEAKKAKAAAAAGGSSA